MIDLQTYDSAAAELEAGVLLPEWIDPGPWTDFARTATAGQAEAALWAETPGEREFAALLSPAAAGMLEALAQRARALTRRHFGRTIGLYAPLYLSSHCSGGCEYCGFAADRGKPRHKLSFSEVAAEIQALKQMGIEEVLLLTGERTPAADYEYVRECVRIAAEFVHLVTVEVFPMSVDEYRGLAAAGCTGLTVYQETYNSAAYAALHRWGAKKDFLGRVDAPGRALSAGLRMAGMGVLLGLAGPIPDLLALYRHVRQLQRKFWRAGVSVSFPRVRPQAGGFTPAHPVSDRFLAQAVFAFRICLPETPLVLSTRESAEFRDGMAGVGITKMSVASRTTVGGYSAAVKHEEGQFEVCDRRDFPAFATMLRSKGLEPVLKNWDRVYQAGQST